MDAVAVISGIMVGLFILWLAYFPKSVGGSRRILRPRDARGRLLPAPPAPPAPPRPKLSDDYEMIGCPGCGQPHRYGLDREYLDCYACDKTFSPRFDGRKYESYRKEKR